MSTQTPMQTPTQTPMPTQTLGASDVEALYTRLAEALGRVGEERASLLLATLALDLMTQALDPERVRIAIDRAERLGAL